MVGEPDGVLCRQWRGYPKIHRGRKTYKWWISWQLAQILIRRMGGCEYDVNLPAHCFASKVLIQGSEGDNQIFVLERVNNLLKNSKDSTVKILRYPGTCQC